MDAKLKRTNAKAEGYRVTDLPEYDVLVAGEVIGKVYARLARAGRHYSDGSVRLWHYRVGTGYRTSPGYASKNDARDGLLKEAAK